LPSEHAEAFRASLKRCLEEPSFMTDFYRRFTSSSDEVGEKFRHTEFERQNRVLADSLYVMAAAAQSSKGSIAWQELRHIAGRHRELGIGPGLYDLWLDCLLQAARAHDPQFSPAIDDAWRAMLNPGIAFFRSMALEG
jgi:hemoglobin-like flavoprotein